ncbi:hypothetical protein CC77DRAFT_401772 [Alternaria alternata]|jgi:hypothetical protein|uniref:Tautomerase cis-CaaD-like domain-containing protein n=2 Tax=Alternaria alternata complex TaxID=187734 RepID=A0A177DB38_ALTAL|nr:hypothetical protein CC77DRAFT_401772 [Alternaria alternata]XP_051584839.1 uncharacterized protein J4E82_009193 [Alternaria postmessia]RII09828.1 Tautomerase [Alternaria sp. MG1]RYN23278.1 hypothetical protein AA0115_g8650 [Alternaria tenuissima]KAH6860409.1 putative oxalocrotonate tautomerase [Alternaria alternata]KAI5372136.1 hypothetical protein J4E82_009193 [Alternaria postmessia]OAG16342.1 hypothetical protein CC77DRAFT_401772 [Alternaria alternata]
MPIWLVLHGSATFTDEASREAFAKDVTSKIYKMIPPFYTDVSFVPTPSQYVGGVKNDKMVRFVIFELAGTHNAAEEREAWIHHIDSVIKPHIADKGYDWEFHIEEPRRDLWKIQGLIPPPLVSEAHKKWRRENKPTPYTKQDGRIEKALL